MKIEIGINESGQRLDKVFKKVDERRSFECYI